MTQMLCVSVFKNEQHCWVSINTICCHAPRPSTDAHIMTVVTFLPGDFLANQLFRLYLWNPQHKGNSVNDLGHLIVVFQLETKFLQTFIGLLRPLQHHVKITLVEFVMKCRNNLERLLQLQLGHI